MVFRNLLSRLKLENTLLSMTNDYMNTPNKILTGNLKYYLAMPGLSTVFLYCDIVST